VSDAHFNSRADLPEGNYCGSCGGVVLKKKKKKKTQPHTHTHTHTIVVHRNDIVYAIYQLFHTYCTDLTIYSTTLQAGRSRVRFLMESLEFIIDIILPAALWSWVDSASNNRGYLLGVKAAPSCAECLEIWEPQTTGILTVCPGVHIGPLYLLQHSLVSNQSCTLTVLHGNARVM
jgi:hypothetical protein